MSRVLITGGAGFIGSHLVHRFVEEGAQVRAFDNLSSGNMENLAAVRDRIEFIQGDVQDAEATAAACRDVDYVFHEGAIPSVPKSVADPLGTDSPNLRGTLQMLESARKAGVKRFIFAASSAAYGNNPVLPKREDMIPEPVSPYAVQKVASELYMGSYAQVFGLQTVALRYFNIFGVRQDPTSQYSGVLARFISLMAKNECPTIFGDGETSRDFTHVDNVVQANLLAASAPAHVSGRVYNVATGHRVTLNHAFATIGRIMGFEGKPQYQPEREGDIRHSVADIARAQDELGYRVTVSFEDGLGKMLRKG
ncbi:nucleoside-diphosphate-sugar epimerase [Terriglobus roseus DSM 18391]|uniref:Nucleoside-diphosphate-sugar epimerase n=1 Tax=Terriglobus roseus (strain DSM 18391 / NRRL B-41598 / KBS 63) TaxID=926566 RepID=I3ZIK4_TERRK|nr:SDR family oxidoreductase [Terriglobus roseus]AFL89072.1 nucleoside-diphosphate-sugar epimerase [Terriglobus roseus DSM 18391]